MNEKEPLMSIPNNSQNIQKKLNFRHWRISVKLLVVMLLLTLIPLAVGTYISTQTGGDLLEHESKINLERLAFSTAQRIQQLLADNHQFIHFTSKNRDVISYLNASGEVPVGTQPLYYVIESMLNSNTFINLASVFDEAGTVVAHSNEIYLGKNYLFRDYVQAALSGEEFTSGILVGTTDGQPGIISSSPVFDGAKVIGVISTRIKGQFITDILRSTIRMESKDITPDELDSIDIYLINDYGIVMSHSDPESNWLYKSLGSIPEDEIKTIWDIKMLGVVCPDISESCATEDEVPRIPDAMNALQTMRGELLIALSNRESGSISYCQPENLTQPIEADDLYCDGEWHVIGFSPVLTSIDSDGSGLFMVVVDIPESVFLGGIDTLMIKSGLVAIIMGVIGVLVALFVARMLSKPITRLARAARDVEADRPFEPKDIADVSSQGDEVGNLARVFSKMVVALRARMAELQTIYEIGQEISAGVDFEETLKYILASIHKVIPFDMAELAFYEERTREMVVRADADFISPNRENNILYYEPETARIYDIDQGVMARLVSRGSVLLIPNMTGDQDIEVGAERKWDNDDAKSYLGVALKAKGKVIGSIELVNREPYQFDEDNARLLASIAVQAAMEVQKAKDIQDREYLLEQQILNMDIVIDQEKQDQQVQAITSRGFFDELKKIKKNKSEA